jgi:hypothetical protein
VVGLIRYFPKNLLEGSSIRHALDHEPPAWLRCSLNGMTTRTQRGSAFWRWALIVSALVVVAEGIAVRISGYARQDTGLSALAAVLSGVALVFLFFGSPFLVRSQGWLAIVCWCIAVATVLFSAL